MPESPLFEIPMLEGGSDYPSPDATADAKQINDQFKYIEQYLGIQSVTSGTLPASPHTQELVYETDTGRIRYYNGSTWVTIAEQPAVNVGNTSARNLLYPTPANAAARIAQALKAIKFFNTDKGYTEQYYAQYDDTGVTSATPVREVHGWAPATDLGRVLLTKYTAAVNGTGTVTKKGGKTEFATAQGLLLDNVFSADFDRYELEIACSSVSTSTALEMRFRVGGATDSTANYAYSFREITPGTAETGAGPTQEMIISRAFTGGFTYRGIIDTPFPSGRKTFMMNQMFDADTKTRIGGSQYNANKSFDGFWLDLSGTATFNGELRIYGLPG